MKIGVLTGGGDCPGLNAVIRAVVRKGSLPLRRRVRGIHGGLARVAGRQDHGARPLDGGWHSAARRHHPAHFAHQSGQACRRPANAASTT